MGGAFPETTPKTATAKVVFEDGSTNTDGLHASHADVVIDGTCGECGNAATSVNGLSVEDGEVTVHLECPSCEEVTTETEDVESPEFELVVESA